MDAIRTEALTKSFNSLVAVDQLTLQVYRGELFGLVGPDGAGKTTTMRLLCGILDPTSGEAWVEGQSILKEPEQIKEKILHQQGWVAGHQDTLAGKTTLLTPEAKKGQAGTMMTVPAE